ncbi:hypothetical protein BD309DRAFT_994349 [Dichomitus squalens]|uniref:Organic solute transporter Ostalpha-domain-containing protein n=2 Tax=Dichomitus squalens TaxID=114155 RepID=A0A4Q9NHD0_9APHY|nr:uncharacterized protein DICSQDRAFT_149974 [Dichomitus squalens LYAD-421 SS1]EJF57160.1 hypothetical protein DICSQDRAFT_149974 [Dichomitus squalens LYAD-421 SS1]TBU22327.1 hypothetical protein BD311DRAFT_153848 [Dichomitus squalens]TBU38606.1 hypothetical protein BD309DRAFT_994349 [Dichomitus squalens]TBU58444.1 hypothetical protein BD310DRAFT_948655 [Dichomitus squalens]
MPMLIDVAELSGLAAEGALYGLFLCLFCLCGYDLVRRRTRYGSQLNWPMVTAGVLLIVLATARFIVDVANVFVAFIRHDPRSARLAYLEDVTQPLFAAKHIIFITSLFVGDSFVNYRCWVVWGKNIWVVLLPIGLSCVSTVAGYYTMWAYGNLPDQTILSEAKWLKAFFALSLVANALATSMLAFRIWYVDRQRARQRGPIAVDAYWASLTPIIRIILESGAINAATLFAFVMTLSFGSQGLEVISEMATPLVGIIFSIVILRVGHRRHDDNYYYNSQQGARASMWATARTSDKRLPGLPRAAGTTAAVADPNFEIYVNKSTTSKIGEADVHVHELHSFSVV